MEFGVHGLNIPLAIKCAGTEITPERGYVTVLKTNMVANHVPDLTQMTWKNVILNHVHVIYMYICYFVWKDTLKKLAKNTCVVTSCVFFILSFFSKCKSDFSFNAKLPSFLQIHFTKSLEKMMFLVRNCWFLTIFIFRIIFPTGREVSFGIKGYEDSCRITSDKEI